MTDDAHRADLFQQFTDALWADLPAGDTGDRQLPPSRGIDVVAPYQGIQITQAIQTGPGQQGNPVPHPAIAIERAAQAEIRSWGAQFKPRRRR